MNPYTVSKTAKNVLRIAFDNISAGWEQWIMLSSDRHHDNLGCRRRLERKQLEQVIERGALILDFGDLFCAMQGKYDPRKSMEDIRPEDVGEDYLDRIVLHAAEDYAPYAKHWVMMAWGNHESKIRKHNGVDLVNNLIFRMNTAHGGNIQRGWYGGFVQFSFRANKTKRSSRTMYYFHGSGGGAPVTRGTIQHNRQAVYAPDADILVNGHIHQTWVLPRKRLRITTHGKPYQDLQWHVRTPGYLDSYGDGSEGWEVERGSDPRAQGCVWIRFFYDNGYILEEMTQAVE